MDPRRSNKGFPPLTSINGTGCRRPSQMRKGEKDKQLLTLSAPQGPNTRTSNDNNIFFHSAQGQAATAAAADAAMLRRMTTPSSSGSGSSSGSLFTSPQRCHAHSTLYMTMNAGMSSGRPRYPRTAEIKTGILLNGQVPVTSSVNDDADQMFNCSPIHHVDTKSGLPRKARCHFVMVVQQVWHVVHLSMVVQQVWHVVHLTMVAQRVWRVHDMSRCLVCDRYGRSL